MSANGVIVLLFVVFTGALLAAYRLLSASMREADLRQRKIHELTVQLNRFRQEAAEKEAELKSGTAYVGQRYSVVFAKIRELLMNLDQEAIGRATLETLQKFASVRRAQIFLKREGEPVLAIFKEVGDDLVDRGDVRIDEKTLPGWSAVKRLALFLPDVLQEGSLKGLVGKSRYATVMCAPLVCRSTGGLIGLLNVEEMTRDLTHDERTLFSLVASVVETALINARMFERTRREGQEIAKEREEIRSIAARYVSTRVVDDILKSKKIELGGVKSHVVVLASDIRGFSKMAERLAPEVVVEVLNGYFEEMGRIVEEQGGYVDKFIGDAMMVLFGVPERDGHEEARAVRAALAMQAAMPRIEARLRERLGGGMRFEIGIGIAAGEAVVGNLGSDVKMNYTAIGDDVNIAFRLESGCPGGKIHVSEAVYQCVKGEVRANRLGEIPVKGKEIPVTTYEILGESEAWDPLLGIDGGAPA